MISENTLKVKNLPKELSDAEKEDFLRHFGATQIKIISSTGKQKCIVFAKFDSKEIAKSVMFRLHQINVLNSRVSVEFAPHDIGQGQPKPKAVQNAEMDGKKHFRFFVNKLTAWNNSVAFYQPPPPHLKYAYPKPNRATINNIAHALASVPKFYTQVLHLMNRMNLPPPFSDIPDPPLAVLRQAPPQLQTPVASVEQVTPKEDSAESEIESDPEIFGKSEDIFPIKRKLPQKKAVKRPKFIKPAVVQPNLLQKPAEKTEDVFEKVDLQSQRKIEVRVAPDSLEQKSLQSEIKEETTVGFIGILGAPDSSRAEAGIVDANPTQPAELGVITKEELSSNRIPLKDLSVLPVFKNYHPGAPSCRLYIKNIAKTVEVKELEFIYKRFQEETSDKDKQTQFDVRLMQEGRMKGQAFVTLDNVQLAQKALKETNGFILKDKPLVVVYARSAVPKK